MLGIEIRLPEHLLYKPAADIAPSKESYANELPTWIETMHKMLKAQQLQLQRQDRHEALFFKIGQQVWLRRKLSSRGQNHKLQLNYMMSYTMQNLARNHTYKLPKTIILLNNKQIRI